MRKSFVLILVLSLLIGAWSVGIGTNIAYMQSPDIYLIDTTSRQYCSIMFKNTDGIQKISKKEATQLPSGSSVIYCADHFTTRDYNILTNFRWRLVISPDFSGFVNNFYYGVPKSYVRAWALNLEKKVILYNKFGDSVQVNQFKNFPFYNFFDSPYPYVLPFLSINARIDPVDRYVGHSVLAWADINTHTVMVPVNTDLLISTSFYNIVLQTYQKWITASDRVVIKGITQHYDNGVLDLNVQTTGSNVLIVAYDPALKVNKSIGWGQANATISIPVVDSNIRSAYVIVDGVVGAPISLPVPLDPYANMNNVLISYGIHGAVTKNGTYIFSGQKEPTKYQNPNPVIIVIGALDNNLSGMISDTFVKKIKPQTDMFVYWDSGDGAQIMYWNTKLQKWQYEMPTNLRLPGTPNMGFYSVYQSIFKVTVNKYGYDRPYYVELVDHGSFNGSMMEDKSSKDSLDLAELYKALKYLKKLRHGKKLELLYINQCASAGDLFLIDSLKDLVWYVVGNEVSTVGRPISDTPYQSITRYTHPYEWAQRIAKAARVNFTSMYNPPVIIDTRLLNGIVKRIANLENMYIHEHNGSSNAKYYNSYLFISEFFNYLKTLDKYYPKLKLELMKQIWMAVNWSSYYPLGGMYINPGPTTTIQARYTILLPKVDAVTRVPNPIFYFWLWKFDTKVFRLLSDQKFLEIAYHVPSTLQMPSSNPIAAMYSLTGTLSYIYYPISQKTTSTGLYDYGYIAFIQNSTPSINGLTINLGMDKETIVVRGQTLEYTNTQFPHIDTNGQSYIEEETSPREDGKQKTSTAAVTIFNKKDKILLKTESNRMKVLYVNTVTYPPILTYYIVKNDGTVISDILVMKKYYNFYTTSIPLVRGKYYLYVNQDQRIVTFNGGKLVEFSP